MVIDIKSSYPMEPSELLERINNRDVGVWSNDPATMAAIAGRLGWLDLPSRMKQEVPLIKGIVDDLRTSGFTDAVLLGMGGSSLCPLVFSRLFEAGSDALRLHIMDTTNASSVLDLEARLDLQKTVFLVSSKSGTTVEPLSAYSFFRNRLARANRSPGPHFIAITDADTPLAEMAKAENFAHLLINPGDVGGRYSALSFFGLLPAALTGIDISRLLDRSAEMSADCALTDPHMNPGWRLGETMARLWYEGRDKMTLVMQDELSPFALWVEQLVAESTGKHGLGIVPVVDEPRQDTRRYGPDRWFVVSELESAPDPDHRIWSRSLLEAGMPVTRLPWSDRYSIGSQFYQWEFATALAGSMLGINPFDEPDVNQAKRRTLDILEANANIEMSSPQPLFRDHSMMLSGSDELKSRLSDDSTVSGILSGFLTCAQPGDYYAILAYLPESAAVSAELEQIRVLLLDSTGAATTCSFGPRYLHSTGQLHKGGANKCVVLMITAAQHTDTAIPRLNDSPAESGTITFESLHLAQALGDFDALNQQARRVLLARLPSEEALASLTSDLNDAATDSN